MTTGEGQFTTGWKALVVVTAVLAVMALGGLLVKGSGSRNRDNGQLQATEDRLRELETRFGEYKATNGGTKPKDRSYGE